MKKMRKRNPLSFLPDALRDLGKLPGQLDANLQGQVRRSLSPRQGAPVLPADVGKYLQETMLAPENMLEDARYLKVAPNDFVVELAEANYQRRYQPIEKVLCDQWQDRLLDVLNTTNSRQGRKEYRFEGPVRVRIKPVADLAEDEVRILGQVNPAVEPPPPAPVTACLALLSGGRQWLLEEEITLIGRSEPCHICLDLPVVQQKRLVSGRHAYIRREANRFRLYDGSPDGKASVNGTFVNGRPVPPQGHELDEGDVIILAALDRNRPRVDTPGVVAFVFRGSCS